MNNPVAQRDTRRHVRAGLEISHFRFDPLRFSVMPSLLLLLSVAVLCTYAQSPTINPQRLNGFWKARWIAHPTAPATQFGIFHFRKTLSFTNPPASFIVHVSADNHYRLFVDGRSVCTGPARSDLANWNFETVDLAPYLQSGKNVVAATVWNFGEYRAYAQLSHETGYILQGNTDNEAVANTNDSWKVLQDTAYTPRPIDAESLHTYVVVAAGETFDARKHPWGFEQVGYSDRAWVAAKVLTYLAKARSFGTDGNWQLVPRTIPLLEEEQQQFSSERSGYGGGAGQKLLSDIIPLHIAAHAKTNLLLDQSELTNAYPQLHVSAGKDAIITLTYAEALIDINRLKGNRDSIGGKRVVGLSDRFIPDGGANRVYAPLNFRTFRFVNVAIETADDPLVISQITSVFTGYPFHERASFSSEKSDLQKIWKTGWRTARLCAMDTYFDCPYYEQMQYVGDTRIQALISLYVSGDDRLMKKAITDISHSFIPEGLTQSRYPSRDMQVIPPFSLWWVCMIHDYYMQRKDDAFVQSQLDGIENVLRWYQERVTAKGMLGQLDWWQFVDWSWSWSDSLRTGGVPPGARTGGSSILTLQYAYTLQQAAELMRHYGRKAQALKYTTVSRALCLSTYRLCWDHTKGMLADTYDKKEFSQHANILAVLADAVPVAQQKRLIQKIMSDTRITQATYYFTFYLFEALKKVQLGDAFGDLLKPWYDMLGNGLTTFAEKPEPTRSDCHAWSASPVYEFLSLVCGITPAAPAFKKVRIEPYLGDLREVFGTMPHPDGMITVRFIRRNNTLQAEINLPETLTGSMRWRGKSRLLHGGKQTLNL